MFKMSKNILVLVQITCIGLFGTQLKLTLLRVYGYGFLVCIALQSDMSNHHYASLIIPYPTHS